MHLYVRALESCDTIGSRFLVDLIFKTALAAPSPGGAHTQQLPVAQGSQSLQQEVGAAVREQELGVALLVVQRTQQHTGPPQFRGGDRPGRVGGVVRMFSRQEQKLTILAEPLLLQREGDKRSEPAIKPGLFSKSGETNFKATS